MRERLSILRRAHRCDDCGTKCRAGVTYDAGLRERVDAWVCPECGARFYRDDGDGVLLRGLARKL